jgi:small subunit ribosomal protein S2
MQTPSHKQLLDAGCHFGHMKRKWNPKMSPYIFMERKGIHVIDLNRTIEGLETAGRALRQMAKSGKKNHVCWHKKTSKGHYVFFSAKFGHALRYRSLVGRYDDQLSYDTQID